MAAPRKAALGEDFDHCAQFVRQGDPDRAVALLFAPAPARPFLAALYAFDLETASIRERVSQPMLGEIRLQWWREQLEGVEADGGEGEGRSPVVAALRETIRMHELPVAAFERLLEARIFDLYDDPMPSRVEFEAYAGATASSVIMLGAMILDRSAAPQLADIAGHAGVLETAVHSLAREAEHRSRGQVYMPADILAAGGLDREGWLAGGAATASARHAMVAYAAEHTAKVDAGWGAVPRRLRSPFLAARLSRTRLAALEQGNALSVGPLKRSWVYWRAMRAREGGR